MTFDLLGAGASFSWSGVYWWVVLELGLRYGWMPAGTLPPKLLGPSRVPLPAWNGGYFTNDYQVVSEADARNLAAALERALANVPNQCCKAIVGYSLEDWDRAPEEEQRTKLLEMMSGSAGRRYLKKFIGFCRRGEFAIG